MRNARPVKAFLSILLTILVWGSASAALGGAEGGTAVLELSIKDCLEQAIRENLSLQVARLEPQIQEANVMGEGGVFDPLFSIEMTGGESERRYSKSDAVLSSGVEWYKSTSIELDASLAGKAPTGTEYSIGVHDAQSKSRYRGVYPGTDVPFEAEFPDRHEAFTGLSLTQPLLKDLGTGPNNASIRVARVDLGISRLALEAEVTETAAAVVKAYLDLAYALGAMGLREEFVSYARKLLDDNRKRVDVGTLAPVEVIQTRAALATRREQLLTGRRLLEQSTASLKTLIFADISPVLGTDLIPLDRPGTEPVTIDVETSIANALERRPDYRQGKRALDRADITIRYAKNQRFPRVDLQGSYGLNGIGPNLGEAFSDIGDAGSPQWRLGVLLELPVGNRGLRRNLSIARFEAQQALLDLKRLEESIIVEIADLASQVRSDYERLEITCEAIGFAEEALRAEESRMRMGRSTSHDVLEFEEELSRARESELSAIIDYNRSIVDFFHAEGTLLDRYGIVIEADEEG